jgi:integrase
MKGHIRHRSKDTWAIVIDVGRDPETGKRRQQWHTVKGRKRDAEKMLRELLLAVEKGTYVKPTHLTVGEWLRQWNENYVAIHTTPRTQESYQCVIECHLIQALGSMPLAQLSPQHLQNYYGMALSKGRADGKGGLSARSVLYHHRILSEALSHAVKIGLLGRNVAELVYPPHPARMKVSVLSPDDVSRFLEAARETQYYVFFCTLLYTGLRRGELLVLRWRNLDLDMASLYVVETGYKLSNGTYIIKEPKTDHSRRSVALPPSLAMLLRQYRYDQEQMWSRLGRRLSDADFVFTRADGSPLNPNAVTAAFIKLVRKAGLPHIRLHDLRHTHATLMLKAGVHPKVVSERLGHASVSITLDTYSHMLPGLQEAAAERFDDMIDSSLTEEKPEVDVSKMFAKMGKLNGRPYRIRTCDTLIKSQVLCQLS